MDVAVDLNSAIPAGAPPDADQARVVRQVTEERGQGWTQVAIPYAATPAILAFYRIVPGEVATADVLTARRDLSGVELGSGFKGDFQPATVGVSSKLANYTSAPNTLLTQRAMTRLGLTAEPVGWLLQAKQPLTAAQIADAQHRAAAAGITVETRTGPDHGLQRLRNYATGAGVLVALGVLAMTVGLIRSETAGDLRTLTATGASGATRRTLNAATAGALALLGGILGTAAAYLALIAWHWHHVGYLDRPPYEDLAVLTLGLPVAAVLGAWLLGRTPRTLARRPLE
jgi:putative ABC transport system permease protein